MTDNVCDELTGWLPAATVLGRRPVTGRQAYRQHRQTACRAHDRRDAVVQGHSRSDPQH